MAQNTYSIIDVLATIDGTPVVGLWDGDDSIQIEQREDIGQLHVGADGVGLWSQCIDFSVTITLKLQPTSPTHELLIQKWKTQRAGVLIPFSFSVSDQNNGEGGTSEQCYILSAATMQYGKMASEREWVIAGCAWEPSGLNLPAQIQPILRPILDRLPDLDRFI